MSKIAIVAIGGNSLILRKDKTSMADQMEAVAQTCVHLADMVAKGWTLVITHGNGPQVGFDLRRAELAAGELPLVPLEGIGAGTQGNIGYMIQQCLYNELLRRKLDKQAATVVTQVVVDKDDPAFLNPTKPVGSFMSEEVALHHQKEDGWQVAEDAGRGWRRVVASPLPMDIVEKDIIKKLVNNGNLVICVGGGGIPVALDENGLSGRAAVIDKDYASALLANILKADLLLISTAVDQVAINFGKENQENLARMSLAEAKQYLKEGHFAAGSMGPKIRAVIGFLEQGGKEALITSPEQIAAALEGKTGTMIIDN
ncbi:MAG: carbamate kinase [Clostridiales bacterium]|jgi:carbamate kinase|nr:carbamate kinase [Clostridiales bacterium]